MSVPQNEIEEVMLNKETIGMQRDGRSKAKASEKMEAGFKGRPTKGIERMESKGRQAREEQEDRG